jgi:serine protease AprX
MNLSSKLISITATAALSTSLLLGTGFVSNKQIVEAKAVQIQVATKEIIFQVNPGFDAKGFIKSIGGSIEKEISLINGYAAIIPSNKLALVESTPGFAKVSVSNKVVTTATKIGEGNRFGKALGQRNTHKELINAVNAGYTGKGVTVAVLDSGVGQTESLNVIQSLAINPTATSSEDKYGHGTHVTGIISGKAIDTGVAPDANIINVKLGNDAGEIDELDLILGLQWVFDFKDQFNIKVVNLSVSSTVAQSYKDSPISAAVEQLWLNGVTVVTAAGNDRYNQGDINYAPANDPFVITVGALDGANQTLPVKLQLAAWSKKGITSDGVAKPELNAPGTKVTSYLPSANVTLAIEHPESVLNNKFLEMSGTSVATPIVTGAIALLLEANPALTPNQIKYILTQSAQPTATSGSNIIDTKNALEMAKNNELLSSLNINNSNKWEKSSFINPQENTIDYSKYTWGNLDWTKYTWGNGDWSKYTWGVADWLKYTWGNIDWAKYTWGNVDLAKYTWGSYSELEQTEIE